MTVAQGRKCEIGIPAAHHTLEVIDNCTFGALDGATAAGGTTREQISFTRTWSLPLSTSSTYYAARMVHVFVGIDHGTAPHVLFEPRANFV